MTQSNRRAAGWLEKADGLLVVSILAGAVVYLVMRQLHGNPWLALALAALPIGLTIVFLGLSSLWMLLRPEPAAPSPAPAGEASTEEVKEGNHAA
jgi:Flp pilus assembly protein TadB